MGELTLAPLAEEDLLEVWLFIAEDSPEEADRFLDRLLETGQRLAEFPRLGRLRPDLGSGLHSFPVGNYLLYYRQRASGIELVRVLHAGRDILPGG